MQDKVKIDLRYYIPIVDFISQIMGEHSEIVLHEVQGNCANIFYIKNSLTGRTIGSPATELLKKIIQDREYDACDYCTNYRSMDIDGKEFKSSRLFIRSENQELVGVLCVNTDQTAMIQVGKKLEEVVESFIHLTDYKPKEQSKDDVIDEMLVGSAGNMIDQAIFYVTGSKQFDAKLLNRCVKLYIVKYLNDRDYFAYKNAVIDLASVFEMSEVSIYKYLQEVKKSNNI